MITYNSNTASLNDLFIVPAPPEQGKAAARFILTDDESAIEKQPLFTCPSCGREFQLEQATELRIRCSHCFLSPIAAAGVVLDIHREIETREFMFRCPVTGWESSLAESSVEELIASARKAEEDQARLQEEEQQQRDSATKKRFAVKDLLRSGDQTATTAAAAKTTTENRSSSLQRLRLAFTPRFVSHSPILCSALPSSYPRGGVNPIAALWLPRFCVIENDDDDGDDESEKAVLRVSNPSTKTSVSFLHVEPAEEVDNLSTIQAICKKLTGTVLKPLSSTLMDVVRADVKKVQLKITVVIADAVEVSFDVCVTF